MIRRMNSGNWQKELDVDKPISVTVLFPDGKTIVESISKFDMIIKTLCERHGLNPVNYRIKDIKKPDLKFSQASTLADFEDSYSPEEFNNLTLKLKYKTVLNRFLKKGGTKKRKQNKNKTRKQNKQMT